jgi:hypothetical protein
MIVFTFDYETEKDNAPYGRDIWWITHIEAVGKDAEHEIEIIEQLDAELAYNL